MSFIPHTLLSSFFQAYRVLSALGLIWCALCSSLWVDDDLCFYSPRVPTVTEIYCSDVYYLAFPKDPRKMKILVYGVYAVELLQTTLLTKVVSKQFATYFGNFAVLDEIGFLWFIVPILSSIGVFLSTYYFGRLRLLTSIKNYIVEFVIQLFYASRIRVLARSNIIPVVVVLVNIHSSIFEWYYS